MSLIAALFVLGFSLGAQERGLYSLRLGVAPIGGYHYFMDDGYGITDFSGAFREVSASLSYDFGRAYSWGTDFSAGGYIDFKGYLFHSDGGYQNSTNAMVRVWGLPNFSIGLCALWKVFSLGTVDFMTAYGLEYTHYFQTEKTSAPGFGVSMRASFDIPMGDGLDLCVGGILNASSHAKVVDVEDPSSTFYPFKLLEFGPAIGLAWIY